MNMRLQPLQNLVHAKMDRKQFLQTVGLLFLVVVGLGFLVKRPQQSGGPAATGGHDTPTTYGKL